MESAIYQGILACAAFVLGAIVGSFLNVVIHRLPREISLHTPRRSFCPLCGRQIPWRLNIPIVSWVWLRGRCAFCGGRIPVRYLAVEIVTAALFLGLWWRAWPDAALALGWCVLGGLLVAATFIDLEHFMIPDELTLGGVGAGLLCALFVPAIVGAHGPLGGLAASLLGAALAAALLFGVVELGKLAFGRKRIRCPTPTPFRARRGDGGWDFILGEESTPWEEIFSRPSDRLRIECEGDIRVGTETLRAAHIEFAHDHLVVAGREIPLPETGEVAGRTLSLIIPREAMGLGDVKLLAAIGAFLGWRAALFSIVAASVLGSIVGVAAIASRRREWGERLPFGPYLAAGALGWIFAGQTAIDWYTTFVLTSGVGDY